MIGGLVANDNGIKLIHAAATQAQGEPNNWVDFSMYALDGMPPGIVEEQSSMAPRFKNFRSCVLDAQKNTLEIGGSFDTMRYKALIRELVETELSSQP